MQQFCQKDLNYISLLTAFSRMIIGVSILSPASMGLAMPEIKAGTLSQVTPGTSTSPLNPRPSIFDEPPYRRTSSPVTPQPGEPPLPEDQPPSAVVLPVNGSINVKLTNTTNAVISYQVIGDTNQRILGGKSDVTLQNLRVPVTITFSREDRGLLKPTVQSTSMGLLDVTLDATTSLDEDKTSLRVQQTGAVLLN